MRTQPKEPNRKFSVRVRVQLHAYWKVILVNVF